MNSVADIWNNVLQDLRRELSEITIKTWFDELEAVDFRDGTMYLHCSNDFKTGYIKNLFLKNIKASLQEIFSMEVAVEVLDDLALEDFRGASEGSVRKQAPDFSADLTFDTFVVGPSNKMAYAAITSR